MLIRILSLELEITRHWIHFETPERGFFWSWTTGEFVTNGGDL